MASTPKFRVTKKMGKTSQDMSFLMYMVETCPPTNLIKIGPRT